MKEFASPPTKDLNDMLNDNVIIMGASSGKTHSIRNKFTESISRNSQTDDKGCTVIGIRSEDQAVYNQEMAKILADIAAKEEDCLRVIHTRYCIPRALKINVSDLSRFQPDSFNRPNYWEYYYKHGTVNEYFLMSREVAIIGGEVKLNIVFNAELAREGE